MSMRVHVLFAHTPLPTRDAWQTAIAHYHFDLVLDPQFMPERDSGFLPAQYRGQETGFEYEYESNPVHGQVYAPPEAFTHVVNFYWIGDMRECVAATIAAAVLTVLTEGVLYDAQEGRYYTSPEVMKMAHHVVEEIDTFLENR